MRMEKGTYPSWDTAKVRHRECIDTLQKVFKLRKRSFTCQWRLKLALRQRHCIDARIRSKDTPSEACRFEWYSPTATEHIGHQLTGLAVPQDEVLGNRALELPYVRRQLMQRALLMCAGLRPVRRCRGGHGHDLVIARHRIHGLHGYPSWDHLCQPILAKTRRLSRRFSRMGFSVARPTNF